MFKNYFVTAQLIAGLAMAARLFPEGIGGFDFVWNGTHYFEEPNYLRALLYAIGGFFAVIPITALGAGIAAAIQLRRWRRLSVLPDRQECL